MQKKEDIKIANLDESQVFALMSDLQQDQILAGFQKRSAKEKEMKQIKFANNGTTSLSKRLVQRRYDAKRKYGLTLEKADELRSSVCEICGIQAKKMCIDHKIAGTYRGVLCQQCNTRLGWLEKNLEVILKYKNKEQKN